MQQSEVNAYAHSGTSVTSCRPLQQAYQDCRGALSANQPCLQYLRMVLPRRVQHRYRASTRWMWATNACPCRPLRATMPPSLPKSAVPPCRQTVAETMGSEGYYLPRPRSLRLRALLRLKPGETGVFRKMTIRRIKLMEKIIGEMHEIPASGYAAKSLQCGLWTSSNIN